MDHRTWVCAAMLFAIGGLGAPASAQDTPPVCPIFVTIADPTYCQINAGLPAGKNLPGMGLLSFNPSDGLHLLNHLMPFSPQESSLLSRSRAADIAPPYSREDNLRIGAYQDDTAALQSGSVNKAYDLPILDGVAFSNNSAVSQGTSDSGTDDAVKSFNSRFGLAYEEYGLKFNVNPDAAINWGALAGSANRRFGIDNQISTTLTRDLTLTLSSGYATTAYLGDPAANMNTERHGVAVAQHFQSGYKFGLSAQRRNEIGIQQQRDLNVFGLMLGVPLSESLNLTANHEFSLTQKYDLQTSDAVPLAGTQQMLDLQLHWTPALLASRAMTIMAGYMISHQDEAGIDDPYLSQARLNLAMRF